MVLTSFSSRQARRRMLAESQNCRFVDRDEFCQLLLGYRRMVRADDSASGVRGLRDLKTGILYVIEREKLAVRRPHIAES